MDLGLVLAIIGIAIPVGAFVWEFAVVGSKQLGYRIQMDTSISAGSDSEQAVLPYANSMAPLGRPGGRQLLDPSLVLVRIENSGTTHIDRDDYAIANGNVGMRIEFPGRRVVGMVATEFSQTFIGAYFGKDSGFAKREVERGGRTIGLIDLPRTPLNPGAHFKILALLESTDPSANARPGEFGPPRVIAGIKGGLGHGGIRETRARMGLSWWTTALIVVLAVALFELGRLFFLGPAPISNLPPEFYGISAGVLLLTFVLIAISRSRGGTSSRARAGELREEVGISEDPDVEHPRRLSVAVGLSVGVLAVTTSVIGGLLVGPLQLRLVYLAPGVFGIVCVALGVAALYRRQTNISIFEHNLALARTAAARRELASRELIILGRHRDRLLEAGDTGHADRLTSFLLEEERKHGTSALPAGGEAPDPAE